MDYTEFEKWLHKNDLPAVPFIPTETRLVWNRQDAWARNPETRLWWYLAVDRPKWGWTESFKDCDRSDL